jgi:hypothetical protein
MKEFKYVDVHLWIGQTKPQSLTFRTTHLVMCVRSDSSTSRASIAPQNEGKSHLEPRRGEVAAGLRMMLCST